MINPTWSSEGPFMSEMSGFLELELGGEAQVCRPIPTSVGNDDRSQNTETLVGDLGS